MAYLRLLLISLALFITSDGYAQSSTATKIIFIRHAEKPEKGNNLTCKGLNRALQLPKVISAKFGIPDYIYVPALGLGNETKHSRMFETAIPLATKYNLSINTKFESKDSVNIAKEFQAVKGTILVIWEHKAISSIVKAIGINNPSLKWPDEDYDSIWIITYKNGLPVLSKDTENIHPEEKCAF